MLKPLLRHPKPMCDESLGGYILRLAQLNKVSAHKLYNLSGLMKGRVPKVNLNPYLLEPDFRDLSTLSELTETNVDMLQAMAYPTIIVQHRHVRIATDQLGVHIRKSKVCPLCLMEMDYIRKVWDLSIVTVCPQHQCLLIDRCPECSAILSYNRPSTHECRCGFDLRFVSPPVIPVSETALSGLATTLISGSFHLNDSCFHNILSNKPAHVVIKTILFYGKYHETTFTGSLTSSQLRNRDVHRALVDTFALFDNWPNNFWTYLGKFSKNGIGAKGQFGKAYFALYSGQFKGQEFDFLRQAFEQYLSQQWDNGNVNLLTRIGHTSATTKFTTGTVARKLLGTHQKYIKRLIVAGKLRGVVRKEKGSQKELILVENDSLNDYIQRLKHALTLEQTAKILGLDRHCITRNEFYSLLTPLRGPTVDGTAYWYFDRQVVTSLLERISQSVIQKKGNVNEGKIIISFQTAYRVANRYRPCLIKQFIEDIGTKLCPCANTEAVGLQQFLFDKDDVVAVYKNGGVRTIT